MNSSAHHAVAEPAIPRSRHRVKGLLLRLVKSPRGIQSMVVAADTLAVMASFAVFYAVRVNSGLFTDLSVVPLWLFLQATLMVTFCWLFLFWFFGMYVAVHNRALFDEYYAILKVLLVGFFLLVIALYLETSTPAGDSRSNRFVSLLIYFCLIAATLALGRYLVRVVVRRLRRRGIGLRRTIIVGDSPRSRQLLEMFDDAPELGFQVIGTVSTGPATDGAFQQRSVGSVADLDRVIVSNSIEVTVLAVEKEREVVSTLMTETAVADTTIKIIPDLYDLVSGQARAQHLYGIPLIEINPRIMPAWEAHLKRIFDVVFSLLVLVIGLPFWLLVALAVKLEDRGPVFYSQPRIGIGGREFTILKFRSMRTDAHLMGNGANGWTESNDPRVTRVGRILRRSHLDEIPQFWNILVGDMSIVGPRPEQPYFVERFSQVLPSYPRRLRVKPGLTGWNQVQMDDPVPSVEFVQERLRHDFFYIENMSLRLDIEIILRTILRVIQRKGQA